MHQEDLIDQVDVQNRTVLASISGRAKHKTVKGFGEGQVANGKSPRGSVVCRDWYFAVQSNPTGKASYKERYLVHGQLHLWSPWNTFSSHSACQNKYCKSFVEQTWMGWQYSRNSQTSWKLWWLVLQKLKWLSGWKMLKPLNFGEVHFSTAASFCRCQWAGLWHGIILAHGESQRVTTLCLWFG